MLPVFGRVSVLLLVACNINEAKSSLFKADPIVFKDSNGIIRRDNSLLHPNLQVITLDRDGKDGKYIYDRWLPNNTEIRDLAYAFEDIDEFVAKMKMKGRSFGSDNIDPRSKNGKKRKTTEDQVEDETEIDSSRSKKRKQHGRSFPEDKESHMDAEIEMAVVFDKDLSEIFNYDKRKILRWIIGYFSDINHRFKTLERVTFQIRITSVLIIKSRNAQPFVEDVPKRDGVPWFKYVFEYYPDWIQSQRYRIPRYDLSGLLIAGSTGGGGFAYCPGTCRGGTRAAMWDEYGFMDGIHAATHEIGHTLSATDEVIPWRTDQKICPAVGYAMSGNRAYYRFLSLCSNREIGNYVRDEGTCVFKTDEPITREPLDHSMIRPISLREFCTLHNKGPVTNHTYEEECGGYECPGYVVDLDNTPCSDGKHCFRGVCRHEGHLLLNVGSGLCLRAKQLMTASTVIDVATCPLIGNPVEKFAIVDRLYGKAIQNPFAETHMRGSFTGERCLFTNHTTDGEFLWTDRCEGEFHTPHHTWQIVDVGNKEFLLVHESTQSCAKRMGNNFVGMFSDCDKNDKDMVWKIVEEPEMRVSTASIMTRTWSSKGNIVSQWQQGKLNVKYGVEGESIFHPDVRVITLADGQSQEKIWKPTQEEFREIVLLNEKPLSDPSDERNHNEATDDKYKIIKFKPILKNHKELGDNLSNHGDYLFLPHSNPGRNFVKQWFNAVLELLIVCDAEFSQLFQNDPKAIFNYVAAYVNDWNYHFGHLKRLDLSFLINAVVIIPSKEQQPFIEKARDENGTAEYGRILPLFSSWIYSERDNLPKFDLAILFTNSKQAYHGGLSYLGSVCYRHDIHKMHYNALVLGDQGDWESMDLGAHQIAHALGAVHDQEYKDFGYSCEESGNVMDLNNGGNYKRRRFSACTDHAIGRFVRTEEASCLARHSEPFNSDVPPAYEYENRNDTDLIPPSMTDQCQMRLNISNVVADENDERNCEMLRCWVGDNMIELQPLETTPCQGDKHCLLGKCVETGVQIMSVARQRCIRPYDKRSKRHTYLHSCTKNKNAFDRILIRHTPHGKILLSPYYNNDENVFEWLCLENYEDLITSPCKPHLVQYWTFIPLDNDEFMIQSVDDDYCLASDSGLGPDGSEWIPFLSKGCNSSALFFRWRFVENVTESYLNTPYEQVQPTKYDLTNAAKDGTILHMETKVIKMNWDISSNRPKVTVTTTEKLLPQILKHSKENSLGIINNYQSQELLFNQLRKRHLFNDVPRVNLGYVDMGFTSEPHPKNEVNSAVVELLIVCDKSFSAQFQNDRAKLTHYFGVYFNDLSLKFKPLRRSRVSFLINEIIMIESKHAQPFVEQARNSSGTAEYGNILPRFASWVYKEQMWLSNFDLAILFTNDNSSKIGGLTYLGGVCRQDMEKEISYSSLIVQDDGMSQTVEDTARLIAHSFGAKWDDEYTPINSNVTCSNDYLMSTRKTKNRWFFSECTDIAIETTLQSKYVSCLKEIRVVRNPFTALDEKVFTPLTMTHLCQQYLNSSKAYIHKEDCNVLECWLGKQMYRFMQLQNTPCGKNGRCVQGECRQIGKPIKNVGTKMCLHVPNPHINWEYVDVLPCSMVWGETAQFNAKKLPQRIFISTPMYRMEYKTRCLYYSQEGGRMLSDTCKEEDTEFLWEFLSVDTETGFTNQFLLFHQKAKVCIKIGSTGKLEGDSSCNSSDASMLWTIPSDDGLSEVVKKLNVADIVDGSNTYDINDATFDGTFLHASTKVISITQNETSGQINYAYSTADKLLSELEIIPEHLRVNWITHSMVEDHMDRWTNGQNVLTQTLRDYSGYVKPDDAHITLNETKDSSEEPALLELLIVCNKYFSARFGHNESKILNYIGTFFMDVNMKLMTLAKSPISLLINGVIVIKTEEGEPFMQNVGNDIGFVDYSKLLENFSTWIYQGMDWLPQFDLAILITHENILVDEGLSYLGGACRQNHEKKLHYGTMVFEDEGLWQTTNLAARQIALSLGAIFDEDYTNGRTKCENSGFIMGLKNTPDKSSFSPCTDEQVYKFLRSEDSFCLKNIDVYPPPKHALSLELFNPPKMSALCKLYLNNTLADISQSGNSNCEVLECWIDDNYFAFWQLENTPCADNGVCHNGKCTHSSLLMNIGTGLCLQSRNRQTDSERIRLRQCPKSSNVHHRFTFSEDKGRYHISTPYSPLSGSNKQKCLNWWDDYLSTDDCTNRYDTNGWELLKVEDTDTFLMRDTYCHKPNEELKLTQSECNMSDSFMQWKLIPDNLGKGIKSQKLYDIRQASTGDIILHPKIKYITADFDEGYNEFVLWSPTSEKLKDGNKHLMEERLAQMHEDDEHESDGKRATNESMATVKMVNVHDYVEVGREPSIGSATEKDNTIELLVVCDKYFGNVFNHDKHKIIDYLTPYFYDVNLRLKTLPQNQLSLVINGVVQVAESSIKEPFMDNARDSDGKVDLKLALPLFAEWAYKENWRLPRFDLAILLTNSGDMINGGMSYFQGACNLHHGDKKHYGTIVVDDNGLWQSVDMTTHQIGHALGALHDDDNECMDTGYIMNTKVGDKKWFFSPCSDASINTFILSNDSICLRRFDAERFTQTYLQHDFYKPPPMGTQCQKLLNSPSAFIEEEDTTNCKVMECWVGDNWSEFSVVDNTPCYGNGRCFRGQCKKQGALLMNVGTGDCIHLPNPTSHHENIKMLPCSKHASPLGRFWVEDGNHGKMISSLFSRPSVTLFGKRCLYINTEMKTFECSKTDSDLGWELVDVGNEEVLMRHKLSNSFAKQVGTEAIGSGDNNETDPLFRWKFVYDVVPTDLVKSKLEPRSSSISYDLNNARLDGIVLHPSLQVTKVTRNSENGFYSYDIWTPTNADGLLDSAFYANDIKTLDSGASTPRSKPDVVTGKSNFVTIPNRKSFEPILDENVNPTVELLVVVDKELGQMFHYDSKKILHYVTVYITDVNTRFKTLAKTKPSFIITGILILTESDVQPFINIEDSGDGELSLNHMLSEFSTWLYQRSRRIAKFDLALLLTHAHTAPEKGIAYFAGACHQSESERKHFAAVIIPDDGAWQTVEVAAHHIAYALGAVDDVTYDKDDMSCSTSGYVMGGRSPNLKWFFSKCSAAAMDRFLRSNESACLRKFDFVSPTGFVPMPIDHTYFVPPSMSSQCKWMFRDETAFIEAEDKVNCNLMECWMGDRFQEFLPVTNTPCFNGRCFWGKCHEAGALLMNVDSNLCLRTRYPTDHNENPKMGSCIRHVNPLARFVVSEDSRGTLLTTPYTAIGEISEYQDKCLYLEETVKTFECDPNGKDLGWTFDHSENDSFILNHSFSSQCAMVDQNGNIVASSECSPSDSKARWKLVYNVPVEEETQQEITVRKNLEYDIKRVAFENIILHPEIKVVTLSKAPKTGFLKYDMWSPVSSELMKTMEVYSVSNSSLGEHRPKPGLASNREKSGDKDYVILDERQEFEPITDEYTQPIVEVLIVCDHAFASVFKHDRKRILHYVAVLMTDVNIRLKSLPKSRVAVLVTGIVIASAPDVQNFIDEAKDESGNVEAAQVLPLFSSWIYDRMRRLPKFDVALLLTNALSTPNTGFSYLAGACHQSEINELHYGTAVIAESGYFANFFTVAHHIAHLLGARHDTEYDDCQTSGYTMGEMTAQKWFFSPCADTAIAKFLKSKESACLHAFDTTPNGITVAPLNHSSFIPPSMNQQCKWRMNNNMAFVEQEDRGNCEMIECWVGDEWIEFPPLHNTPCTGGRCFNGKCRKPGALIMNPGTQRCLYAPDLSAGWNHIITIPCPQFGSPFNRFKVVNSSNGKVFSTYYTNPGRKDLGDRCMFYEGEMLRTSSCIPEQEASSEYVYHLIETGVNNEVIISHRETQTCVKIDDKFNVEMSRECDKTNGNFLWKIVPDNRMVLENPTKNLEKKYDLKRAHREGVVLHPVVKVIKLKIGSNGLIYDTLTPTNEDIQSGKNFYTNYNETFRRLLNFDKNDSIEKKTKKGKTRQKRSDSALDTKPDFIMLENRPHDDSKFEDYSPPVVELLVVCDLELSNVFQQEPVQILHYLSVYFSDVNLRLKTLTRAKISVLITGIVMITTEEIQPFITEARNSEGVTGYGRILPLFGSWVYQRMRRLPKFDMAILLTNSRQETFGGRSYFAGACLIDHLRKQHYSTVVIGDSGAWLSVHTTSHHLAHALGARHDSDYGDECSNPGFIMGAGSDKRWFYSSCSDKAIQKFVQSSDSACLHRFDASPSGMEVTPLDHKLFLPPPMHLQCKWTLKSDIALIEEEDKGNCKMMECWMGDNWYEFPPVHNTPCNNGRCFQGRCRKPGSLIVNVGSGRCLFSPVLEHNWDHVITIPCPQSGTYYNRFVVMNNKNGKMFSTPFVNVDEEKQVGEQQKCIYLQTPGDSLKVWYNCDPTDDQFIWKLLEGDIPSEVVISNPATEYCIRAHPTEKEVITDNNCDKSDPFVRWKILRDVRTVAVNSTQVNTSVNTSTLTATLARTLTLHPKVKVVKVSVNPNGGYLMFDTWIPTNKDLQVGRVNKNLSYHATNHSHHLAKNVSDETHYVSVVRPESTVDSDIDEVSSVIEIVVVCDKDFADLFNQDRVRILRYVTIYFREINMRFATLKNTKVSFLVTGVLIIKDQEAQQFVTETTDTEEGSFYSNLLNKFSTWIYKQTRRIPKFDLAILLTNFPHEVGQGGKAFLGGVCHTDDNQQLHYGTLVVADDGSWRSVVKAVDLIAHSLGAVDDEEYSDDSCVKSQHIMRKSVDPSKRSFSECASKAIKTFLESSHSKCLRIFGESTTISKQLNTTFATVPTMMEQCRRITSNPSAMIKQDDTSNCQVMECWDGDNWFGHPPLENTPCLGGFCVANKCMTLGYLIRNVATGECIRGKDSRSRSERAQIGPCPSVNSVFDRFEISDGPNGKFVSTPFLKGLSIDKKCTWINWMKELWLQECNPEDRDFDWEIIPVKNGEFLMKSRKADECVTSKLISEECDEDNVEMRWKLLDDFNNEVNDLSILSKDTLFDLNRVEFDGTVLHPNIQILQFAPNSSGETRKFDHWKPSEKDLEAVSINYEQMLTKIPDSWPIQDSPLQSNYVKMPNERQLESSGQSETKVKGVVELLVVCDANFSLVFGNDKKQILDYLTILFWDVNFRFKTLKMDASVSILITGVIIISDTVNQPFIDPTAGTPSMADILSQFSSWAYKMIRYTPKFDLAVLITNTLPPKSGLGYFLGTCHVDHEQQKNYASVIFSDDGSMQSVLTATQQIAHSLGVINDGGDETCTGSGNVMDSTGNGQGKWYFSSCSDQAIGKFLRSAQASCLKSFGGKSSLNGRLNQRNLLPPSVETQCQLFQKSPSSTLKDANCAAIECTHGDVTESYQPLQNTPCMDNQGRCIRGRCEKIGKTIKNVGSGECMRPENFYDENALIEMVPCPIPGSPLDQFVKSTSPNFEGTILNTPRASLDNTENDHRCLYLSYYDQVRVDKCDDNDSSFAWDLGVVGDEENGEFIMWKKGTFDCARPKGKKVVKQEDCDEHDRYVLWKFI